MMLLFQNLPKPGNQTITLKVMLTCYKLAAILLPYLQVLQNDVLAHQSTVEAVNKAGNDLIESSAGEEASSLQNKLEVLNQRWQNVLEKTEQRKQQLDGALRQVNKRIHSEIFYSLQDQISMEFFHWLTGPCLIFPPQGEE